MSTFKEDVGLEIS